MNMNEEDALKMLFEDTEDVTTDEFNFAASQTVEGLNNKVADDESLTETTVMPFSVSRAIIVLAAIVLALDILLAVLVAKQIVTIHEVVIIGAINILLIPAILFIQRTVKNNDLIAFSGEIINVDCRGIKNLNYYKLVTVQSSEGKILNFKCGDSNKFVEGNPVTFFMNKNTAIENSADGPIATYISYQFSIADVEVKTKEEIQKEKSNKMTAEEFLMQEDL